VVHRHPRRHRLSTDALTPRDIGSSSSSSNAVAPLPQQAAAAAAPAGVEGEALSTVTSAEPDNPYGSLGRVSDAEATAEELAAAAAAVSRAGRRISTPGSTVPPPVVASAAGAAAGSSAAAAGSGLAHVTVTARVYDMHAARPNQVMRLLNEQLPSQLPCSALLDLVQRMRPLHGPIPAAAAAAAAAAEAGDSSSSGWRSVLGVYLRRGYPFPALRLLERGTLLADVAHAADVAGAELEAELYCR
jgi:hypothetical protein